MERKEKSEEEGALKMSRRESRDRDSDPKRERSRFDRESRSASYSFRLNLCDLLLLVNPTLCSYSSLCKKSKWRRIVVVVLVL